MPERVVALLLLVTGEVAERYVGRLLVDTAAVYFARRDRATVRRWLRRQGLL
jgi:hypothetical protein